MQKSFTHSPVENFIEQMGLITQADGGPRIAGRILGLMIVEERPFTLQEIAERLNISKASASTNARMLAERGVLRLLAHGGDRQDYYELGPDPFHRMLQTIEDRMRKSAAVIAEAEARFTDADDDARRRVARLANFYRQSADFLGEWAKRLTLDQ